MFTKQELRILFLMAAVNFCLIVDFMIVMPQGPQLMNLFNISAQKFSLIVSAYTFGAGFMGILTSFFIDRFDRKKSLIWFFTGFAIGNIICAVSQTYEIFLFARFVTGAFGGVVGSLIFAVVSDLIPAEKRSSAFGFVLSAFAIASIVGVPLCLLLSNKVSWHSPYLLLCLLSLFLALVVHWRLPSLKQLAFECTWHEFKSLFTESGRSFALLFVFFLILGHFSVNPFLFPSIVTNGEISESRLPIVYLSGGLASVIASIFFGRLADRFGKKIIFAYALISSLVAIYFATNVGPSSIAQIVLVVSSFFVLMGGRLTPALALVSSTVTSHQRGSFLNLIGSIQQLAAALASFLAGLIVVKTDAGKLLNFNYVGMMAIVFSLIALFISRKIAVIEGQNTRPLSDS